MSSGWMTWMWAMWGRVSDGPLARRAASTASRALADGAFADGVEMRLEARARRGGDMAP